MIRPMLTLVPRHTFQEWTRQRLVDIHVELQVLRADLRRLQRQTQHMGRCPSCTVYSTLHLTADGFRCRRCQLAKELAG